MNILVTGANGQLGNEMRLVAGESDHTFIFSDVVDVPGVETLKLDITDIDAVRSAVAAHKVDAIVNCAAYTNVDAAESNGELAETLNAKAPQNLAVAMEERGGLLVHISTDYVLVQSLTTHHAQRSRPVPLQVYTALPNSMERSI